MFIETRKRGRGIELLYAFAIKPFFLVTRFSLTLAVTIAPILRQCVSQCLFYFLAFSMALLRRTNTPLSYTLEKRSKRWMRPACHGLYTNWNFVFQSCGMCDLYLYTSGDVEKFICITTVNNWYSDTTNYLGTQPHLFNFLPGGTPRSKFPQRQGIQLHEKSCRVYSTELCS